MYICSMKTQKITAKQIKKGMTLRVTNIDDATESLNNMINDVKGWGSHTAEEKIEYQSRLDNNNVLSISSGSIKKDSPIVKVYDINLEESYSYQGYERIVTINYISLKTDKGNLSISTRQKVELVN